MLEPIAIIGMAGRFPAARDLTEFWDNLTDGRDCLTDLDDDDLMRRGELPEYLAHPHYVRRRPRLDEADMFDARCFGMTPREAEIRDPQQRVLLEVAHSAVENAGYDPGRYPGPIGVFAGTNLNRYRTDHLESSAALRRGIGFLGIDIGNSPDYVATFLSHRLGLRGPSMTVQTACSTALTAVHLACLSLRAGDCDMAIAGASSVGLPLDYGYIHAEGGILARDGTPRPFDADADGTNFGNGCGAVLLKRLDDALADRDTVIAVIRGSAVNNDGERRSSFSSPSAAGQADCVAQALRHAGLDPRDISYVEAHGTGTKVGDPVEIGGLAEGFRRAAAGPLPTGYCRIGSVKGNVGHMGQASGICGLIKTALALSHELIPPTIHVSSVNPLLELDRTPFTIGTVAHPWPRTPDRPRRAGVSSFGIGGTNGHVVLEEPPQPARAPGPARDAELIVWSGAEDVAVDELQNRLAGYFESLADEGTFRDAAYTLRTGRVQRRYRAAVVARDAAEAGRLLRDGAGVIRPDTHRRDLVFCFPGQGSQYPGMAHRLYDTEPVFRRHCDEAFDLLRAHLDGDLRARWLAATDEAELSETVVAQPLLFVIEHALARTLIDWGLRPDRLVGHSVGELVAATVAGVFDLPDGLAATAARARPMQEMPRGTMLAVAAGAEQVRGYLTDEVGLAAVNGPRQTVLSGPADAVTEVGRRLRADGVRARPLRTSHAFHSAMMAPAAKVFDQALGEMTLHPPAIPVVSCATGELLTADEAVTPSFWAAQLVEPVRFADALRTAAGAAPTTLLETGPGRALSTLARGCAIEALTLPTLPDGDGAALDRTLGRLWVQGYPVDLDARDRHRPAGRVPVPGYPYRRRRFWIERPAGVRPVRDNEFAVDDGRPPTTEPAAPGPPAAPAAPPPTETPPSAATPVAPGPTVAAAVPATAARGGPVVDAGRHAPRPAGPATGASWSLGVLDWVRRSDGRVPVPERPASGGGAAVVLPTRADLAPTVRTAFQLAGYRTVRATLADPADDAGAGSAGADNAGAGGAGTTNAGADNAGAGTRLDPGSDRDWDAFLDEVAEPGSSLVVAFAGLLDAPESVGLSTLTRQLDRGYFRVLACARAAARAQRRHRIPVTLVLLTRYAVDVTGAEPVNPATAMAPALLRTVEQEHPGVTCVTIDVAPGTPADVLGAAVAELSEPLTALRGTASWTPVLRRPVRRTTPGRPHLRQHGVYLITGGLGGIGLTMARTLAETGRQPRIALVGRSGGPPAGTPHARAVAAAIAGIRGAGAQVLVLRADAADPASLREAVDRVQERFGPVNGIVHAAGVAGGLVDTRARADTRQVFAPKLHGTLAIEECFADRAALDFLMLFSSQAALTGMFGSADYAAANAFLNAHAQQHGRGARWTMAVDWPAWSEVGMWAATATADDEPEGLEYRRIFDKNEHWELDEHRFWGVALLPGTSVLELVVTAARAMTLVPPTAAVELRDTVFAAPVNGAEPVEVRVAFTPVGEVFRFTVGSRSASGGGPWTHHVNGNLAANADRPEPVDIAALRQRFTARAPAPWRGRLQVGPRWRTPTWTGDADGEQLVELVLPAQFGDDLADHPMHAALLDRARLALLPPADDDAGQYLPFLYRKLTQFSPMTAHVIAHGRPGTSPPGMRVLDLDVLDAASGALLVTVAGLTTRQTAADDFARRLTAAGGTPAPPRPRPQAVTGVDLPAGREPLSPRDGAGAFLSLLDGAYPPVVLVEPPGAPVWIPGLPWADAETAAPVAVTTPTPAAVVPAAGPAPAPSTTGAVPAPVAAAGGDHAVGDVTAVLFELWAEALGVDDLALDDDFFELGGDSLVAVQLSARVRQRFDVELSAAALFEASTIRGLAAEITALQAS